MTVALFVLPLLYTFPRGRRWWDRWPGWLLAAQAVLTYLPFAMFGQKWAVGLSGLLGGLLLLTLPARVSWPAFGAVVAVEGVLRLAVFGVYPTEGMQFISFVFVVPIDTALPLFGLVRLSDLVAELRAARTELAELAVIQERRAASARLRVAIDGRLEAVSARAGAALAVLAVDPVRARGHLAEAAAMARQAVERVRVSVAEDRRDDPRPAPRRTGNTVAPRLALLVLVVNLAAVAGHNLVIVADTAVGAARAVGWAAIVAIVALQLYHSAATRAGTRPRGWRVTLTLQVLVLVTLVVATAGDRTNSATGMAAFPAGSALLLLTGWRAGLGYTVLAASVGAHWLLLYPGEVVAMVYLTGLAAAIGMSVYGLSRLTDIAEDLEAARRELARAAVDQERLRVDQDTHDLLGLGLSAVALKCDLAVRLIGRDDVRARAELDSLVRLSAQARADIRAVTTGEHGLSLHAELAAARDVLASAGVEVVVDADPRHGPLPKDVDTAIATVLREAVTNVLRHARASRCEITLITTGNAVSLRVANDGVTGTPRPAAPDRAPARSAGGHGLTNLAARAEALRGHLTAHRDGSRFELTVRVPLPT